MKEPDISPDVRQFSVPSGIRLDIRQFSVPSGIRLDIRQFSVPSGIRLDIRKFSLSGIRLGIQKVKSGIRPDTEYQRSRIIRPIIRRIPND
jgi:hypothetical protein